MVEVFLVGVFPQSELTTYLDGSGRSVARHNLDVDACIHAALHGFSHIGTYRVGDCHGAQEDEVIGNEVVSLSVERLFVRVCLFVCKHEGTHSLAIIRI